MIGQDLDGEGLRFAQGPNQWPSEDLCPGFRETFMEYFEAMRMFSRTMMRIVASGLGLEEGALDEFVYGRDSKLTCYVVNG